METPSSDPEILIASVALEPARWAGPAGTPVRLSPWLERLAAAGYDGVELWERHLADAQQDEASAVIDHHLPVRVLNSYVSLDDPGDRARAEVAALASRCSARAIKFNVGNDPAAAAAYAERIAAWLELLDPEIALLCECHHGISIAEDPVIAAAIFDAAAPPERLGAIVHTHEPAELLRSRFDAYGDRIAHVHCNFLDFTTLRAPRLLDVADRLAGHVALLEALGFSGSWAIEFVEGVATDHDAVEHLVTQACEDIGALRAALGGSS